MLSGSGGSRYFDLYLGQCPIHTRPTQKKRVSYTLCALQAFRLCRIFQWIKRLVHRCFSTFIYVDLWVWRTYFTLFSYRLVSVRLCLRVYACVKDQSGSACIRLFANMTDIWKVYKLRTEHNYGKHYTIFHYTRDCLFCISGEQQLILLLAWQTNVPNTLRRGKANGLRWFFFGSRKWTENDRVPLINYTLCIE